MITEAVDATLRSIREILHKRAHLSSRSQALDELSKLLFAHVEGCAVATVAFPDRLLLKTARVWPQL